MTNCAGLQKLGERIKKIWLTIEEWSVLASSRQVILKYSIIMQRINTTATEKADLNVTYISSAEDQYRQYLCISYISFKFCVECIIILGNLKE